MIAEIRKMMGQADLFIRAEKTVSVSDRPMRDAEKRCDDDYLVRCLDEQITIAVQLHWIHTAPEITDRILEAGLIAFEHITSCLDKDKFSRMSFRA